MSEILTSRVVARIKEYYAGPDDYAMGEKSVFGLANSHEALRARVVALEQERDEALIDLLKSAIDAKNLTHEMGDVVVEYETRLAALRAERDALKGTLEDLVASEAKAWGKVDALADDCQKYQDLIRDHSRSRLALQRRAEAALAQLAAALQRAESAEGQVAVLDAHLRGVTNMLAAIVVAPLRVTELDQEARERISAASVARSNLPAHAAHLTARLAAAERLAEAVEGNGYLSHPWPFSVTGELMRLVDAYRAAAGEGKA